MKKLVVLTGAGISQESGIPTFRELGGLWEEHDVMAVASPQGWDTNPELVLDFYNKRRQQIRSVKPNRGHEVIAEFEEFFETIVITQNIDNLHEKAGSTQVLHLHGNIFESRSDTDPTQVYKIERSDLNLGDTDDRGNQLRPNVVWFGEMVPNMEPAIEEVVTADIFIVAGTSLVVYPAAGLLEFVGPEIPKFVIDPNLPDIVQRPNLFMIPEKAGTGMDLVKERLLEEYL